MNNLTAEVAIKISQHEKFDNYSDSMQYVYDITGNDHKIDLGFGQVDIDFTQTIEKFKLSDREKDLLYISQFFHHAWKTLHISLALKLDTPSPYALEVCYDVFKRLKNYGLEYQLLKTISEKKFLQLLKKAGYNVKNKN
jgi:hypothetical protein